jgi:geranylgeranyl pyrophosphate synthase
MHHVALRSDVVNQEKNIIYQNIVAILKDFAWVKQYNKTSFLAFKQPKLTRATLTLLLGLHLKLEKDSIRLLALIGELLHFATKTHDRIVNNSDIKHNETCVLMGDYFYAIAFEKMLELTNNQIVALFAEHCKEMAECEIALQDKQNILATKKYVCLFQALGKSLAILANSSSDGVLVAKIFEQYGNLYISKDKTYKPELLGLLQQLNGFDYSCPIFLET